MPDPEKLVKMLEQVSPIPLTVTGFQERFGTPSGAAGELAMSMIPTLVLPLRIARRVIPAERLLRSLPRRLQAAVRTKDGQVISGQTHSQAVAKLIREGGLGDTKLDDLTIGFVDKPVGEFFEKNALTKLLKSLQKQANTSIKARLGVK